MSKSHEELSAVLGEPAPEALEALPEEHLDELTRVVRQMQSHQEKALQQAVDDALSHIPRLLRKSVRKMLFS